MSGRWRLIELNVNLPKARFLGIEEEGQKPAYDPDWRRLEPLAAEPSFQAIAVNGIGDRLGPWQEGPKP